MVLSSFPETVWPWRKIIVSQIADLLHEVPWQRGYQGEVEKKGAMHPHPSLGKWTFGTQRKTLSAWPVASKPLLVYVARKCAQGEEMQEDFDIHQMQGPGCCGSVDWSIVWKPKGHEFNSRSGHMTGWQVRSPVRAHSGGNRPMFLSLPSSLFWNQRINK